MLSAADYWGPIGVTLAYLLVYYGFITFVVLPTKTRLVKEYADRGEKFDRYFGQDRQMLAADRVQLNMLEHMAPFLVLLWLHAAFTSVLSATIAGAVYVVSRGLYPVLMGGRLGRGVRGSILASTVPGYLVLLYLMDGLVYAVALGMMGELAQSPLDPRRRQYCQ